MLRLILPAAIALTLTAGCSQSSVTTEPIPTESPVESPPPAVSENESPVAAANGETIQRYLSPLGSEDCQLPDLPPKTTRQIQDASEIPESSSYEATIGFMRGIPSDEEELSANGRALYWDTELEGGTIRVQVLVIDDKAGSRTLQLNSGESKCAWKILHTSPQPS